MTDKKIEPTFALSTRMMWVVRCNLCGQEVMFASGTEAQRWQIAHKNMHVFEVVEP